jgi:hypothetical protein
MFRTEQLPDMQLEFARRSRHSREWRKKRSNRFSMNAVFLNEVESQYSNEQNELLGERLSDAEVRELLERLGDESLGGPEEPTVGAVIEATGASPLEVGRLLAEIRQESLERRFSETFDDHEGRIEKLELTGVRTSQAREFDPEKRQILEELAAVEQRKRSGGPIGVVLILVALLAMGVFLTNTSQAVRRVSPSGFGMTDPQTGVEMSRTMNGAYRVQGPNGLNREATPEERSQIDAMEMMSRSETARR